MEGADQGVNLTAGKHRAGGERVPPGRPSERPQGFGAQAGVPSCARCAKSRDARGQALHPRREGQTSNADDEQIGVITPWRAQVAAIRAALDRVELRGASPLVDTVERYQGSERDVIIISLATNDAGYLQGMTDLWRGAADAEQVEHSVDRKLNVALTRAREQIILLGRLEVVGAADGGHYGALFEYISEHGRYFSEDECAALDRLAQPILAPTAQTTPQSA